MPVNSKKKTTTSQSFATVVKDTYQQKKAATAKRLRAYIERRPHRSFRLTKRRDAVRPLHLPGFISFTRRVNSTLWKYRKQLGGITLVYAVLTGIFIGVGSQEVYQSIVDLLEETSNDAFEGDWAQLGEALLIFSSLATSGLTGALTDVQQLYTALLLVLVWLTTVWLLRQRIAGHAVRIRDALYNAGAPIVPTILIGFVLLVQLIPLGVAMVAYSAASSSGLIDGGVEAMLFWMVAGLLTILSMYWLVGSFFAMIVVTLPGTYPIKALSIAGDIVTGRRMPILLRILWMLLIVIVVWALVLIPTIIIDGWIKGLIPAVAWLPVVPFVLLLLGSMTVVWSAGYIYILYRSIVEEDARVSR